MRAIERVTGVVNEIEVLPLSPDGERIRAALYRSIYNADSTRFRYATRAVPPVHIIVENARATLTDIRLSTACSHTGKSALLNLLRSSTLTHTSLLSEFLPPICPTDMLEFFDYLFAHFSIL